MAALDAGTTRPRALCPAEAVGLYITAAHDHPLATPCERCSRLRHPALGLDDTRDVGAGLPMMTPPSTQPPVATGMGASMSALPTLSVVIIARNEEAYIAQCIEAVLAATASLQACEILLVDSPSDDRTVAIASTYPIRIVCLSAAQRCCPAMGRHVGARVTQGEYVLFVDGDSTIAPQWVDTALSALMSRSDVAGIAGREDQIYYRDGIVIGGKPDYFGT